LQVLRGVLQPSGHDDIAGPVLVDGADDRLQRQGARVGDQLGGVRADAGEGAAVKGADAMGAVVEMVLKLMDRNQGSPHVQ